MAHSFMSRTYRSPNNDEKKISYVLFHNNESHPDSPVTIVPYEIDGEKLGFEDPRRVEFKVPFGLLARFVGMRVLSDKVSEIEQTDPLDALGLRIPGGRVVLD